eukprot:Hpha_TRINITY_DN16549_c0_g1::TRINITY_DN16549_c0_g1_i2::g.136371::m.136371
MSTEDDVSELRDLIPHVLRALHTNKVWESVKGGEEISCAKFKGDYTSKPHIGILTPRNTEESPVVVKFESKVPLRGTFPFEINPQLVEIHQMLSDQGLATTLLAVSLNKESVPNFTVESIGECYFDQHLTSQDGYWDQLNSPTGGGGDWARLLARLHKKVPVQWFDKYRGEIRELCPPMKDEADDSALWVMTRMAALAQARLAAKAEGTPFMNQERPHAPSNEDVKRIADLLPRPRGEHASRVVTCHGDLWGANVVKDKRSGQALLIDLEGVTVSYAATEFAQFRSRGVCRIYLEKLMEDTGSVPTEEDIDRFWLEVIIAGYVQVDILRPTCWEDSEWDETSTSKMIAHVQRFSLYVEKMRNDWELCQQVLRKVSQDEPVFTDEAMSEVMDSDS